MKLRAVFVLAALILLLEKLPAQSIHTGIYCEEVFMGIQVLEFLPNGALRTINIGCTGASDQRKRYELTTGGILKTWLGTADGKQQIQVTTSPKPSDSIRVSLRFMDAADSGSVGGVQLYLAKQRRGTVSDDTGNAKFNDALLTENDVLVAKCLGGRKIEIPIDKHITEISGTIWFVIDKSIFNQDYEVITWNDSIMTVRHHKDIVSTYKRITMASRDSIAIRAEKTRASFDSRQRN
jgi:hypothetical protein